MSELCEACGAKVVRYPHNLNKGLLAGLRQLYRAGPGDQHLEDLNLTYSQRCNFQKLQYWGLVAPSFDESGKRLLGYWRITNHGRAFILGHDDAAAKVWTYRGQAVAWEGTIRVDEVFDGEYMQREEWAASAVPHTP